MSYLDMVVEAIFNLQERKGSSPKAIWGYLQSHFAESVSNYNVFRLSLKRVAGNKHVERSKNGARYKLDSGFRRKIIKFQAKSGAKKMPIMAMEHAMTMKVKSARKAASKMRKAAVKKRAGARKAATKTKKRAAAKSRAKATKARKAAKKSCQGRKSQAEQVYQGQESC